MYTKCKYLTEFAFAGVSYLKKFFAVVVIHRLILIRLYNVRNTTKHGKNRILLVYVLSMQYNVIVEEQKKTLKNDMDREGEKNRAKATK